MPDSHNSTTNTPVKTDRPAAKPQRPWLWAGIMASIASLLTACKTAPEPVSGPVPAPSSAGTPLEYRKDGARHLYARNAERIYPGKLPAMLYAIGVLHVDIDAQGRVKRLSWMRAPQHAPEVVAEIERTVRAAAPFPVASRLGSVRYTDTWLWDQSGRFQLDTLTEGQLGQ